MVSTGLILALLLYILHTVADGVSAELCKPFESAPHPHDSASYYKCDEDGYPHYFVCPVGLHYNDDKQRCDWPRLTGVIHQQTSQRHPNDVLNSGEKYPRLKQNNARSRRNNLSPSTRTFSNSNNIKQESTNNTNQNDNEYGQELNNSITKITKITCNYLLRVLSEIIKTMVKYLPTISTEIPIEIHDNHHGKASTEMTIVINENPSIVRGDGHESTNRIDKSENDVTDFTNNIIRNSINRRPEPHKDNIRNSDREKQEFTITPNQKNNYNGQDSIKNSNKNDNTNLEKYTNTITINSKNDRQIPSNSINQNIKSYTKHSIDIINKHLNNEGQAFTDNTNKNTRNNDSEVREQKKYNSISDQPYRATEKQNNDTSYSNSNNSHYYYYDNMGRYDAYNHGRRKRDDPKENVYEYAEEYEGQYPDDGETEENTDGKNDGNDSGGQSPNNTENPPSYEDESSADNGRTEDDTPDDNDATYGYDEYEVIPEYETYGYKDDDEDYEGDYNSNKKDPVLDEVFLVLDKF